MALFASPCLAFPFRDLQPGETMPSFKLQEFKTGESLSSGQLKGNPMAIIFWGADLPLKEQRSTAILKEVKEQLDFFKQHQTRVIAINIQGDQPEKIMAVSLAIDDLIPIYLDDNREAYNSLGVYVMPTVLLIDRTGKAIFGMGYSRNTVSKLKEEVEILFGEKTRSQLAEEEEALKMTELTPEEKKAKYHMEAGFIMEKRRDTEAAIRQFITALQFTPDSPVVNIELGCLHLEINQHAKAKEYIEKAMAINPESLRGKLCQTQLLADQGQLTEALAAAQILSKTHINNHQTMAMLGNMLQKNDKFQDAAAAYEKAYQLLDKSINAETMDQ